MKNSGRERISYDSLEGLANVPFDDALDALSHVQRRRLLFALVTHNPQDDSPGVRSDAGDDAAALASLVEMNNVHLPKLVEYGFIDWNRDTHEVVKGPKFDEILPLLELLADHVDELPDGWM